MSGGGTRLLLVRHGEIRANLSRVWHGSTDSGLTEQGREQARRLGAWLARAHSPVRVLYSSPLERARDTARLIGEPLGLEPRFDSDLVEYGIGEWEGESYLDLARERGFFDTIQADLDFAPPGGESPRAVIGRMRRALGRIWRDHAGAQALIVGHGAALAFALAELLEGDPNAWQRYQKDNCALSELVLEPDPRLLRFNALPHLEGS